MMDDHDDSWNSSMYLWWTQWGLIYVSKNWNGLASLQFKLGWVVDGWWMTVTTLTSVLGQCIWFRNPCSPERELLTQNVEYLAFSFSWERSQNSQPERTGSKLWIARIPLQSPSKVYSPSQNTSHAASLFSNFYCNRDVSIFRYPFISVVLTHTRPKGMGYQELMG